MATAAENELHSSQGDETLKIEFQYLGIIGVMSTESTGISGL